MLEVVMAATIMYIPGWLRCHEESGLAWSEITNAFTSELVAKMCSNSALAYARLGSL